KLQEQKEKMPKGFTNIVIKHNNKKISNHGAQARMIKQTKKTKPTGRRSFLILSGCREGSSKMWPSLNQWIQ
ncbi:hypothetical protein, partial [Raoultella ornithinolytica]|uniref:hypothetical protein n=2 Tax=Gammaproteobacteria TaxID=1236 RepID=UPI001D025E05